MKRLILLLFCLISLAARAQHSSLDQIRSENWDIIGTVNFKVVSLTEVYAVYTTELKKYADKDFELAGYMIPLREGLKQRRFLLSTLPINQCFYCGKNGIPIMVMVEMDKPLKFTDAIIKITGKLSLSTANAVSTPAVSLKHSENF